MTEPSSSPSPSASRRPATNRRPRLARIGKRALAIVGVLLVVMAVAGYFIVNHLFFDNPPAPPPLGLTPQGSATFVPVIVSKAFPNHAR